MTSSYPQTHNFFFRSFTSLHKIRLFLFVFWSRVSYSPGWLWILLCSWGRPWTADSPALISQVLGLNIYLKHPDFSTCLKRNNPLIISSAYEPIWCQICISPDDFPALEGRHRFNSSYKPVSKAIVQRSLYTLDVTVYPANHGAKPRELIRKESCLEKNGSEAAAKKHIFNYFQIECFPRQFAKRHSLFLWEKETLQKPLEQRGAKPVTAFLSLP